MFEGKGSVVDIRLGWSFKLCNFLVMLDDYSPGYHLGQSETSVWSYFALRTLFLISDVLRAKMGNTEA